MKRYLVSDIKDEDYVNQFLITNETVFEQAIRKYRDLFLNNFSAAPMLIYIFSKEFGQINWVLEKVIHKNEYATL